MHNRGVNRYIPIINFSKRKLPRPLTDGFPSVQPGQRKRTDFNAL